MSWAIRIFIQISMRLGLTFSKFKQKDLNISLSTFSIRRDQTNLIESTIIVLSLDMDFHILL